MKCPKCGSKMHQSWNWADCLTCGYKKKLYEREPMQEREIYEQMGFYEDEY